MEKIRIGIMIPKLLLTRLDFAAKNMGLSRSAMLVVILNDYFNGGNK